MYIKGCSSKKRNILFSISNLSLYSKNYFTFFKIKQITRNNNKIQSQSKNSKRKKKTQKVTINIKPVEYIH